MIFVLLSIFVLISITLLIFWKKADADLTLTILSYIGKKPSEHFEGKVVWITGASSGIGEHLAYALCKLLVKTRNIKIILSARRVEHLQKVKLNCSKYIPEDHIKVVPLDLIDFSHHETVVDTVIEQFGKVDVVVHNAGRSQRADWLEIETIVDEECFRLNALAPANLTRYLLKRCSGPLQIVVTSSIAGLVGASSCASYVAAKHALNGYFRALRTDYFDRPNLKITICCPGLVFAPNNPANAYTSRDGDKHGEILAEPIALHITPERCARLILVAAANNVPECWISKQPVLLFTYLNIIYPPLAILALKVVGLDKMKKMREGKS